MTVGNAGGDSWFRVYREVPEGVRLFCFPHAGGAASYFYPWSRSLPEDVEVQAVQYPGRQDRAGEPRIRAVPELADRIHAAIRPWLTRPFAFFGHSMGAVLAFEVASRIAREDGAAPAHLFVSGRRAPSRTRHERLHLASRATLIEAVRALGGTDPRILADEDLLDLVLPTIRADYTAIEMYRFDSAPPLPCDVTAMVGDSDPVASVEDTAAWAQHTLGRFDLRIFPGGHFYLEDCRPGVLDVISSRISGVRQKAGRP
ncbi:thioesterase II family protein [Streptomyces echinatus]|uniref:Surfactin synthase thioesterase subunit n=1 Tax=Streptomyces echinatus TaxID=67293 RepID=A0A7W9PUP3_9ACTN|nr:alpha/beta fold hydrolase [Streptomyces echinatus]MBB5928190.1 surfactin synthase thioesterase subunit [Streptomyces echinatus]